METLADEAAERAVLGACLLDPRMLDELSDFSPADLAGPGNSDVLQAMLALAAKRQAVDHLTVSQELRDVGKLKAVGGPAGLMRMDQVGFFASTPETLRVQVERIKGLAVRRKTVAACQLVLAQAQDLNVRPDAVLHDGVAALARISSGFSYGGGWKSGAEVLQATLDKIERIHSDGGDAEAQYVKTGVEAWDKAVGGILMGGVTFVVAQPSVGKTALTASIARSLSERGEKVGVLSLEDAAGTFARRYVAEETGYRIRDLMTHGALDREQLERVWEKGASVSAALRNLWIDDERNVNARRAAAKIRQKHARDGTRVFMVDHMMEMFDWESEQARDAAVHLIVMTLRDAAIQLQIGIVLNAHLKDTQERFRDERFVRPKLQDIVGGRAAEQKARIAVALWEQEPPKEPEPPKPIAPAKPRKGETEEQRLERETQHAEALKKQQFAYEKKHREWEQKVEWARDYLIASVIKANEGTSGVDFPLRRVRHAGTISREASRG